MSLHITIPDTHSNYLDVCINVHMEHDLASGRGPVDFGETNVYSEALADSKASVAAQP